MINPSTGALSVYPTPDATSDPNSIVSGPGGDLWFLDPLNVPSNMTNIASIDPTTHAITEYPVGGFGSALSGLAVGPDGQLWFADYRAASVGVFNPTTQAVTRFPLPSLYDMPRSIAPGPDGNLWFTVDTLGRTRSPRSVRSIRRRMP